MIQGEERDSKIDIAVARYKQGKCPCCSHSMGGPRGLEYRARSMDLYCHTCKRRRPTEVDLKALRDELAFPESAQADVPLRVPDVRIQQRDSGRRHYGIKRLGSLIQRIILG